MIPRITLQIQSCPESLNRVDKFLCDLKKIYDIGEEIYCNILMAVREAVTNAIKHGNKFDTEKLINIAVFQDKNLCVFSIEDEGDGFDYSKIKNSILNIGGMGISLMKKLSRHLRFYKDGRCVKMFFYTKQ